MQPDWWRGIDGMAAYDLAEYLRCVFVESETAVAVLTSGPGLSESRMLFNREMAGRASCSSGWGRRAAAQPLRSHADVPGEVEGMERELERHKPVGWKVLHDGQIEGMQTGGESGWQLDDERTGVRFLARAQELACRWCARTRASASWWRPAHRATSVPRRACSRASTS